MLLSSAKNEFVSNVRCFAYEFSLNLVTYDYVIPYIYIESDYITYQMKGCALSIKVPYLYWFKS